VRLGIRDPAVVTARTTHHSPVEDALGLVTGTSLAALGVFVLSSSGLVTGGTAGLSLLLSYSGLAPFGVVFGLLNLPFFAVAWLRRGPRFTLLSVASVAAVSFLADREQELLGALVPEPLYAMVLGNLLAGAGILVLFRHSASLGGFNIVALMAQDRWGVPAGYLLLVLDVAVILGSLAVSSGTTVLMSAFGAIVLNLILAVNHRPGRYAALPAARWPWAARHRSAR
jgi:uncharacterized membrane-anchored protein YitT (DUF2179 family)